MRMREQFLYVEKYRPHTVADTILPDALKATFQSFVDKGNIPNMTLIGGPGIGKTTIAKAMCDELGIDYIVINGSLDLNKDALRNDVQQFASSVSFTGGRKMVIVDEADGLRGDVQAALRAFTEEFAANCGFILTANFGNRLIEALLSRCPAVSLSIKKADKPQMAMQFMKRCASILDQEQVSYTKEVLAAVIQKHFPDFRKTLSVLQHYASATGTIDTGILVDLADESVDAVKKLLREKNFTGMRKWVGEHSDMDQTMFFRALYDKLVPDLEPNSAPQLVMILADYQYKAAFVADQEINTAACLTEIMASVVFKG